MACGWPGSTPKWWQGRRSEGNRPRSWGWRGQLERQAGSREDWGPWVSGPPGVGPRTVWKVGVRQGSQGLGPGPSAGHAGSHPGRPCARPASRTRGARRTEASRPFHETLCQAGSHMEGGRPGHSAFRWRPRPPARPPAGSCSALGKQPRKSSGNTNPTPSPPPTPPTAPRSLRPGPPPRAPGRGLSRRGASPAQWAGW